MRRLLVAFATLSIPFGISSASAQEPMLECIARYHTTSQVKEDFPGALAAFKNRPCKHAVNIKGIGARAPGSSLARLEFAERPKHGKISAKSASTFVFLPNREFTGSDSMLVRYHLKSGKTMSIRFAITVS